MLLEPASFPQVIPFSSLSPEACEWIADRAGESVNILRSWGLDVAATNPIREAILHLRRVAVAGSYGRTLEELEATATALTTVSDWNQITSCLTEDPVAQIAEELAVAVTSGATTAKGEDLRSQFWFGALLARAGLRPAVPPAIGRRPDFVVFMDNMPIAVEVKRPQSMRSAIKAVKAAAGQIRDYKAPGFVAVDLSRALGTDILTARCYFDQVPPERQFAPVFLKHARTLSDRVRGYQAAGRFARVLGLFTFGRLSTWHYRDPSGPQSSMFLEAPVFPLACGGIIQDTAKRVKAAVLRAMGELSGNAVNELG